MKHARLLVPAAACAALLVVLAGFRATGDQPAEVVDGSLARHGWKTIEHLGVRIDLPSAWERSDMSGCQLQFPHWAPPDAPPCDYAQGASFYGSATFDPAHGPGLRQTTAQAWAGYKYAGDFAVYASGPERDLIRGVLDSVRVTGN